MAAEVIPMETKQKRIGSQTPTKSVILPYQRSRGKDAIKLYEKSGRKAFDWQRFVVDAILAINAEGLWTHMTFGFSVPRQNGKNEIVAIRELFGLDRKSTRLNSSHVK